MNAPVTEMKVRQWSAAVPLKTPDNIISSQYTSQKVFVPSYEKEKRPCIEQLITNEYQRIWWQEKEIWDKRHNRKPTTKKLLQRMVIRKKSSREATVELPKKSKKPRRKVESKIEKVAEESKEPKTKEIIPTQTGDEKGENEPKET
ncbi:uncharacterized protein LOC116431522 [Nomia melanderi]|uniref:uncharacterized protein LOC116431522 n=1 Tax=Nomia melanderi TaxID=2448451 RepID=UPI0013046CF4|nr:uncharacterized protein LOC116431522 [Nomia melanderi]XP_031842952.1 uncharacterized protein LOC116431522 [Nomia melanderi]XP_031842962.1 uncharacterized protein LOC116431522 [Nomia melanderi]XP_031842971.1 uncharacterized protein LOC116431522 [Nomia melanderi]XP_031842978.1 uncharacterized protein LOC116431522 [Nomia melanderi]XP_031842988.1 uncharacterized protein LOC116431522 [Nomia melanderi]XP_031842998.1 uncharacterized protein LOC116431522 [Nomia melanderi]XP_031843007.1 uncharacte